MCHNRVVRFAALALITALTVATGQPAADDDFHVYRDPPRLLLTAQRLRLLERERERDSVRWQFLDAAAAGPDTSDLEKGFARALYYRVAHQNPVGRQAVDWALSPTATDLRQLALVFDWCAPLFTPAEADRLARKLQAGLAGPAETWTQQSARALAAIALADRLPDAADGALRSLAAWVRTQPPPQRADLYAAFELLHAIRDNTKIDLRQTNPQYFSELPLEYIAGVYPAPFPGSANDLRVPVFKDTATPNPTTATRDRAAGLAMVALDTNAVNYQFAQGLLMSDRFILRDPFGAPYEFLWANPYQPGLAYQTLPLVFHSAVTGHLFARTSWEEDATWVGYFDGTLQLFRNGGVQMVRPGTPIAPLRVGPAVVTVPADANAIRARLEGERLFVLGLAPRAEFAVEVEDQELDFLTSDAGGTLVVSSAPSTDAEVRVRRR